MDSMKFSSLAEEWYRTDTLGLTYAYRKVLQNEIDHLNSFIGDMTLDSIKPRHINDIVIALAEKNPNTMKPMAKTSLEKLVHTTKRIFEYGIDNEYCLRNPARHSGKVIPKNAPQKIVTAINRTEQLIILQMPHRCQIAALLMMLTGLRTSEMLGLEWKDINFEEKSCSYISEPFALVRTGMKYKRERKTAKAVMLRSQTICASIWMRRSRKRNTRWYSHRRTARSTPRPHGNQHGLRT